jgi:hypothetical protein
MTQFPALLKDIKALMRKLKMQGFELNTSHNILHIVKFVQADITPAERKKIKRIVALIKKKGFKAVRTDCNLPFSHFNHPALAKKHRANKRVCHFIIKPKLKIPARMYQKTFRVGKNPEDRSSMIWLGISLFVGATLVTSLLSGQSAAAPPEPYPGYNSLSAADQATVMAAPAANRPALVVTLIAQKAAPGFVVGPTIMSVFGV